MITVNINDAIPQMPLLFDQVMAGEDVVFYRGEIPVMELRPVPAQLTSSPRGERMLGNPPFPMTIPASFFDPLPNDLLDAFEGKNSTAME